MSAVKNIVSPKWLHDHMKDDDLVILEVCQTKNKAGLSFDVSGRISGSISVDLKLDFSDLAGNFSNSFPSETHFEYTCNRLGISNDTKVIIIDRLGIYTSPRIWFLFRAMGHENVAVLDGGLPAWINDGYEVIDQPKDLKEKGNYRAQLDFKSVKSIEDVIENIKSGYSIIVDARSSDRFLSLVPEPRPEISRGNIPNSINIPFNTLLDGYKYKGVEELQSILDKHNLGDRSLMFSCGSGVTACIVMLASELVNTNKKSIYNGSWTEWASIMNV